MSLVSEHLEVMCIVISHQDEIGFGSSVPFDFVLSQQMHNFLTGLIFHRNLLLRQSVSLCDFIEVINNDSKSFIFFLIRTTDVLHPSRKELPCGMDFRKERLFLPDVV